MAASYAQDTTLSVTLDTSYFQTISVNRLQRNFNHIDHSPNQKDVQRYKNYKYLIGEKPTSENYELYYFLACSLWELQKTEEAEDMFLTIINSKEKYYSSTYSYSSDIMGDTTTSSYGYGSFTTNYKNYAATYLTKIYLEQRKFAKALQYLEDAVKKYKVTYNCGTGFQRQEDEYDLLYASCLIGLKRYREVMDILFPFCLDRNDNIIITAIRKTYSKKQIQDYLKEAETSIKCLLDTFPSYSYRISNYGTNKEKTDTISYFSGTATITLFGRIIIMPLPYLENGEQIKKEKFLNLFKESDFYIRLKDAT